MNATNRLIVLIMISVLGLALLNACSSNGELDEVNKEALSKLRIVTGHYHAGHRLMTNIALEKGWFREEGLNEVEISPLGTNDDWLTLAALVEGKADIVWDAHSDLVVQASANGMDVYAIDVFRSFQPGGFIFARKGISSLKELTGKRIGVNETDGMDARKIRKALKLGGVSPDQDVVFVPRIVGQYATQTRKEALEKDVVQALSASGAEAEEIERFGFPALFDLSKLYPKGYPIRFMVTTGRLISEHPGTIKGFLRGIIRAKRFAADDENKAEVKAAARRLLQEDISYGGERAEVAREELAKLDKEDYTGRRGDYYDPEGLEFLIQEQKELGYIPASYTVDKVIRMDLVQEAAREIDQRSGGVQR